MDLGEVAKRMAEAVEWVKTDVATIRTGRATPSLVENIVVTAYGGASRLRLVELATISVADVASLVIAPYDPSLCGDIRRDIEAANVGLVPVIDNNVIRIAVPPLTQERRLEYVRLLHHKLEDGRVRLRRIRHDKMTELKRLFEAGSLHEDERKGTEKELQDLTDKAMEEIEIIGRAKEAELTRI